MNSKNLKLPFVIALIHCLIGNVIGVSLIDSLIVEILFLPYTFIAGLSQFAGWGLLSILLEIFSIAIMTLVFYPLVLLFVKKY